MRRGKSFSEGGALSVSIHASVKDATCGSYYGYSHGYGFNPRICKRCDLNLGNEFTLLFSFNPRICKRCDGNWIKSREYFNVSIHASVKDATPGSVNNVFSVTVSIHASVKDAT